MQILTEVPVDLSLETVLPRVRVEPDSEDAPAVEKLLERVRPIVKPKAVCALCFIDRRQDDTLFIGDAAFTSRVLAVNLADTHRVFPYIATCGRELDDPRGLAEDPLEEYWLDQVRIIALHAAIGAAKAHLEQMYEPGKLSSMSPGSLEDWPVSEQTPLFSLFGDVQSLIGVQLTDSYLMVPLKSVSGIYFPTESDFSSCRLCPRRHCPGRQAGYEDELWQERYAKK